MKLEHEQDMFLAAMRGVSFYQAMPPWCTAWHDGQRYSVMFPTSSAFKRHACVVAAPTALYSQLEAVAPSDAVHCMYGVNYHFYKDGADAMEGTGANAALRQQQESGVLR